MRSRLLCLGGSIALFAISSCKEPESKRPINTGYQPPSFQVPLPVERKLVDKQGRELDARIIGKNPTHLTVIRKLDQKQFEIEIANLSLADQNFVLGLLDQRAPRQSFRGSENSVNESRISYLEREISRREDKISELSEKMMDPTLAKYTSPRKKGMQTEVKKIEAELVDLNLELHRLQREDR